MKSPVPEGVPRTSIGAVETKARLRAAARDLVCEVGVAASSARKIASRAGINQALIFYHFSSVSDLIAAASNYFVDEAIEHYRNLLDRAEAISDLVAIGEELHAREGAVGNVVFMTQILAEAPHDPVIAAAARYALSSWTGGTRSVLERVLSGTVVDEVVDIEALVHLVTAGFIGLELYSASDGEGGRAAIATVGTLAKMIGPLLEPKRDAHRDQHPDSPSS